MVYTVKRLSCKCHKLSSQNVHVTQFNVVFLMCYRMSSDVSVCGAYVGVSVPCSVCVCVGVSVLCSISATVYKHMVEFAKEW